MSAAGSPPRILPFDPAAVAVELRNRHIRRRGSTPTPFAAVAPAGPPAPEDEPHWYETADVIEVGAGLVVPVQRFLQARPPSRADSRYLRHLDAYLAIRLGEPRAIS